MSTRAYNMGNVEGKAPGPYHTSADYEMGPADFQVVAESSAAAVTITLPPKCLAIPGMVYTIYAPAGASYDVSVNENENDTEISTYGDLDANGDTLAVVCTGETWAVVASVLS